MFFCVCAPVYMSANKSIYFYTFCLTCSRETCQGGDRKAWEVFLHFRLTFGHSQVTSTITSYDDDEYELVWYAWETCKLWYICRLFCLFFFLYVVDRKGGAGWGTCLLWHSTSLFWYASSLQEDALESGFMGRVLIRQEKLCYVNIRPCLIQAHPLDDRHWVRHGYRRCCSFLHLPHFPAHT